MIAALTALAACLAMSPRFYPIQIDEARLAWEGHVLTRGGSLYHDAFTHRPPLGVWLTALVFTACGSSLLAARVMMLVMLVVAGWLMWALLRRLSANPGLAFAAALYPAWACFPVWPQPSAHWMYLPFALGALLLLERALDRDDGRLLLATGVLGGLTGLVIQTEGAVTCAWLLLRALPARGQRRRRVGLLLSGMLIPVALTAGILLLRGNLAAGVHAVVLFPLTDYHSTGGFNDVDLLLNLRDHLRWAWVHHGVAGPLLLAANLTLILGAVGMAARALYLRRRTRERARLACAALLLAVFARGRTDWIHLMAYAPLLLVLLAESAIEAHPEPARRAASTVVTAALACSGLLWVTVCAADVTPTDWVTADDELKAEMNAVLAGVPAELRDEPLLAMPFGGVYYLYRDAASPPIDWIFYPSQGYFGSEDLARVTAWIAEEDVRLVLLQDPDGPNRAFLEEASPLQELLQREFVEFDTHHEHLILVRRGTVGR